MATLTTPVIVDMVLGDDVIKCLCHDFDTTYHKVGLRIEERKTCGLQLVVQWHLGGPVPVLHMPTVSHHGPKCEGFFCVFEESPHVPLDLRWGNCFVLRPEQSSDRPALYAACDLHMPVRAQPVQQEVPAAPIEIDDDDETVSEEGGDGECVLTGHHFACVDLTADPL